MTTELLDKSRVLEAQLRADDGRSALDWLRRHCRTNWAVTELTDAARLVGEQGWPALADRLIRLRSGRL